MRLNIIAPNQTEVHLNEKLADSSKKAVFFFSYGTPVAAKIGTTYYKCEDKFLSLIHISEPTRPY